MAQTFFYFDVKHAVSVHDWIIDNSGGRHGINDLCLLESPLEHIKNDQYYPEIEDKVTLLVYGINKNHAFTDGNKRSSITLAAYFLEINGYGYCVKEFVKEMENIAVWIADNYINRDLTLKIVRSLIFEDEFSESLKLEIAVAIY
ncbi:type II toxin-antitoxin system death-on-curing family toxin [Methylophaga thalassica]|uniref:type II toxin-antitoxin system death-on-curing family toxin n=1 Tax=Methylophaga aminisulfidivorans TaxID=230105 RepID=UPI003A8E3B83